MPQSYYRRYSSKTNRRQTRKSVAARMALAGRSRAFQRPSTGTRSVIILSVFFSLLFVFALMLGTGLSAYAYVNERLPSPGVMGERQSFQSTFIYDRHGTLLYEVIDPQGGRRLVVPLEDICQNVIDATIATEDATFYTNPGVDTAAFARAMVQNFSSGEIVSGFSTITMQLVRNVLLPEERFERSLTRKMKETILSYQVSQSYSKDQILEMYLNEIPYGNMFYGIEAAAQGYFGKAAKDLNLAEASLLAGLPQSPADYNPLENPELARRRQAQVLAAMVKHGYITQEEADTARKTPLTYQRPTYDIKAPHFTLYVRDLLVQRFGHEAVYQHGLRVYTTIDLEMLEIAEKVAREHIEQIKDRNANNAALVAIDPKTAEVLVMMGSIDYYDQSIDGQVNMAVHERQPGSALKPFAYATAFEKGILTPESTILDKETVFPGLPGSPPYIPRNHDLRWHGDVPVREALACSLNMPAVWVLQRIGIANFLDTLHTMGISSLTRPANFYGLSIVLGGAEVKLLDAAYAYTPFANKGLLVGNRVPLDERKTNSREFEPVTILRVTDANGEVLYTHQPQEGQQVIRPETAYYITNILSDDENREGTYGRHSYLELTRPAAAKTGTTEYFQDGWTIGYTPDLVTGVWVGNADNSAMKDISGVAGAGHIWHNFMEEALKGKPALEFSEPDGLVTVEVCRETGLLPGSGCITHEVKFTRGSAPKKRCVGHATPTPAITPGTTTTRPTPTVPAGEPVIDAKVIVPNLVGLSEEEARKRLNAHRLLTSYINWQSVDDIADKNFYYSIPNGHILSQQPLAGAEVDPFTTVYLAARKD